MRWPVLQISWLSYLIAGIMVVGAILILSGFSFNGSEYSLKRALNEDMSRSGSSGRVEAEKLKSAVIEYVLTRSSDAKSNLNLSLAIVKGRTVTWSNGSFGEFVSEERWRQIMLQGMKDNLAVIRGYIQKLDNLADDDELLNAASELSYQAHRLGFNANQTSLIRAAEIRNKLQTQQAYLRRAVEFLLAVGGFLLIIAIRQNASLAKTSELAKSNARRYSHLAKHDPVTGLPNRTAVDEELAELAKGRAKATRICVLALDLDGFKRVNDMFGHIAGDAALRAVAQRLKAVIETSTQCGTVSRVGGDEFLVILQVDDDGWELEQFAGVLLESFVEPFDTASGKVTLGLSIGYSEATNRRETCFNLVMNADLALTEAKSSGKNRFVAYDADLRTQLKRREAIEEALKTAVANREIHIAYQPIYDILSGECVGFEALARWDHPQLGEVGPAEFIPVAETTGDIVDIGEFVLLEACKCATTWERPVGVSVNLSMAQILRSDVVQKVRQSLLATGLPPERLKLEITESVLISDFERTESVLADMRAQGTKIALDDFGTGYSGLSYLSKLHWDEIKIDRSFVDTTRTSRDAQKVVEMVVEIAAQLGSSVTIEGIETEPQRELFAGFGCGLAQGFLFGRPSAPDLVPDALNRPIPSLVAPKQFISKVRSV